MKVSPGTQQVLLSSILSEFQFVHKAMEYLEKALGLEGFNLGNDVSYPKWAVAAPQVSLYFNGFMSQLPR